MPSPVAGEQTPHTVRYRIEEELRNFEHSPGHALYVIGKHAKPLTLPQPRHGEIRNARHYGQQGLQTGELQQTNVLKLIRLLDESDRLLNAPAREVALNDLIPPNWLIGDFHSR